MMNKTILIAGGSGLIGTRLAEMLQERQYTVRLLTRTPDGPQEFGWNPMKGKIDDTALQGVDYVINLAGAGIADKRWTPARKKLIIDSRVQSAQVLAKAFLRTGLQPKAYLSASAIGYYGNSGEQLMTETDTPVGDGFLVDCCQQWEQAAETISATGIRTVKLRIGVVLAKEGGALAEIVKPLRLGLGAYFGNGQAWWSWIHRDDLCNMIIWALENPEISGVFNGVAPAPARGKVLVQATAKAMDQIAVILPAPSFVLRVLLGEMSAVVLNSNRVSSQKIAATGYRFLYPELNGALKAIFDKKPEK